jgi:hypothetical protein
LTLFVLTIKILPQESFVLPITFQDVSAEAARHARLVRNVFLFVPPRSESQCYT